MHREDKDNHNLQIILLFSPFFTHVERLTCVVIDSLMKSMGMNAVEVGGKEAKAEDQQYSLAEKDTDKKPV